MKKITRSEFVPIIKITNGTEEKEIILHGMTESQANTVLTAMEGEKKELEMMYLTYALDGERFYKEAEVVSRLTKEQYKLDNELKMRSIKKKNLK